MLFRLRHVRQSGLVEESPIDRPSGLMRRKHANSALVAFLRRALVTFLNFALNRNAVYRGFGWLNSRFGLMDCVFLVYPASTSYRMAYASSKLAALARWTPHIVGVMCQEARVGLVVAIGATEPELMDQRNTGRLKLVVSRVEQIRNLLRAKEARYAGILPGVLFSKRIRRHTQELDIAVDALLKAECLVRQSVNYGEDVPIVVLGGRGHVGKELVRRLAGRQVYCVDTQKSGQQDEWPKHLIGCPTLLINVTRPGVLQNYLDRFWPELVILNEVYPEPTKAELDGLMSLGCSAYHLAGIVGTVFPSLPGAYRGAIPCCGARKTATYRVVVRRLCPGWR